MKHWLFWLGLAGVLLGGLWLLEPSSWGQFIESAGGGSAPVPFDKAPTNTPTQDYIIKYNVSGGSVVDSYYAEDLQGAGSSKWTQMGGGSFLHPNVASEGVLIGGTNESLSEIIMTPDSAKIMMTLTGHAIQTNALLVIKDQAGRSILEVTTNISAAVSNGRLYMNTNDIGGVRNIWGRVDDEELVIEMDGYIVWNGNDRLILTNDLVYVKGELESTGTIYTATGFDAMGAKPLAFGSADVTAHTFTSDGTGDGEFTVPDDSIGTNELDLANIRTKDFADTADVVYESEIAGFYTKTGDTATGNHDWSVATNVGSYGAHLPNANEVQLEVKGHTAQGNPILRVRDSANATLLILQTNASSDSKVVLADDSIGTNELDLANLNSTDFADTAAILYETELDTESELETQITDMANIIQAAEIDTEAELEAIANVDFAHRVTENYGGTQNFANAELIISGGTSLTMTAIGSLGIDTTDNVLALRTSAGTNVVAHHVDQKDFTVGDDNGMWDNEAFPIAYAPDDMAITITKVKATVMGSSSPTLSYNIEERAFGLLGSAGTNIFASDQVADATGEIETSFSDAVVEAGAHLVLTTGTNAETGVVDLITGTIYFTRNLE